MTANKATSTRDVRSRFDFEALSESTPDRKEQLCTLYALFQERTFLPELKDVRQFLERHLPEPSIPRSRERGRRIVFELLATISVDRFERIYEEALMRAGGRGDLAIIADAILKRRDG